MPRIELIPPDFDPSAGEGTPTINVCWSCGEFFEEGGTLSEDMLEDLAKEGHFFPAGTAIGSCEVEHPPYGDEDAACDVCEDDLSDQDD